MRSNKKYFGLICKLSNYRVYIIVQKLFEAEEDALWLIESLRIAKQKEKIDFCSSTFSRVMFFPENLYPIISN